MTNSTCTANFLLVDTLEGSKVLTGHEKVVWWYYFVSLFVLSCLQKNNTKCRLGRKQEAIIGILYCNYCQSEKLLVKCSFLFLCRNYLQSYVILTSNYTICITNCDFFSSNRARKKLFGKFRLENLKCMTNESG